MLTEQEITLEILKGTLLDTVTNEIEQALAEPDADLDQIADTFKASYGHVMTVERVRVVRDYLNADGIRCDWNWACTFASIIPLALGLNRTSEEIALRAVRWLASTYADCSGVFLKLHEAHKVVRPRHEKSA